MKRVIRLSALFMVLILLLGTAVPALAESSTGCTHAWDKGKIIHYPTCTKQGTKEYTCRKCGAKKTAKYGGVLDHLWDEGTVVTEPTCTEPGEMLYTCKRCDKQKSESFGEALGHEWGEWGEWEPRDDVYSRSRACVRCGITEEETAEVLGMGGGVEEPSLYLYLSEVSLLQDGNIQCLYTVVNTSGETPIQLNGHTITKPDGTDTEGTDLAPVSYASLAPGWSAMTSMTVVPGADDPVERRFSVSGVTLDGSNTNVISNTVDIYMGFTDPELCLSLAPVSVNSPASFKEGETVSAVFSLTNLGKQTLNLNGFGIKGTVRNTSGKDSITASATSLAPNETVLLNALIYLTVEDEAQQSLSVYAIAVGQTLKGGIEVWSNKAFVELSATDEPEEPEQPEQEWGLTIEKTADNLPAEGYYTEGAPIQYKITVTNTGKGDYKDITITDSLKAGDGVLAKLDSLGAGKTYTTYFMVPAEAPFAVNGQVTNTAAVTAARNEPEGGTDSAADTVTVEVRPEQPVPTGSVQLQISVTNMPVSGYFKKNETVQYQLTVTNTGADTLVNLILSSGIASNGPVIATWPSLAPAASVSVACPVLVEDSVITNGRIIHPGQVTATADSTGLSVSDTDLLETPVSGDVPPVDPKADLCAVSLLAGEEGTLALTVSHCSEHTAAAEEAEKLLAAAGNDPALRLEAYGKIEALWTEEINELYDKILTAARESSAKAIVTAERTAFFTEADAYKAFLTELYPNDPETAAAAGAALLREKCAELCWYVRARRGVLSDSLLAQAVPQNGNGLCDITLKQDTPALAVYALNFCQDHAEAAASLHGALTAVLGGTADNKVKALREARTLWESCVSKAQGLFFGPAAYAEQAAYGTYRQAHAAFTGLFDGDGSITEEALLKQAALRTLRLCPIAALQPQGGLAPTFMKLF